MDVILSELGWQDGFRIPVANEENKHLEEKVKRTLRDLAIYPFFIINLLTSVCICVPARMLCSIDSYH
jgi:hypothetical protein